MPVEELSDASNDIPTLLLGLETITFNKTRESPTKDPSPVRVTLTPLSSAIVQIILDVSQVSRSSPLATRRLPDDDRQEV